MSETDLSLPWLRRAQDLPPKAEAVRGGTLRFAFYGRVSTEDQQDPEASRLWQRGRAEALIGPTGGAVAAEYFDVGETRALPWKRRPRAQALLTALADPDRGFDAVVVGEPQRAFYGSQFGDTFPLFMHYDIPLWVPEVGGAIDGTNEAHDLIMSVFGGMSKGERNRVKVRVHAAMSSQALMEGRFLGGRPPYGYRLRDLGPHPNPGKAAEGKQLHGLEPDPDAAPVVVRIFSEFLRGYGIYLIAEGLTRDGIPSPSAHDPQRNPHRDTRAWAKSAVRAILDNPRYTGRQVWNRQKKHESLLDITDVSLGYTTKMRWNTQDKWVVSKEIVHTPLIDDETFARTQDVLHVRATRGAKHQVHRTRNPYLFRGRITCGACDRRMQSQWSHGDAYYRCRYPDEYGLANRVHHPRNVYLRESGLVKLLDNWLAKVFLPHRIEETIDHMAAAAPPADHAAAAAVSEAQAVIADCDAKLATHRAALEAGADPKTVTQWIAETQALRSQAQATLSVARTKTVERMSRDAVAEIVRSVSDVAAVIHQAEPHDKAELYDRLGLRLTYAPNEVTVLAEIAPDPGNSKSPRHTESRGDLVCVGRGT